MDKVFRQRLIDLYKMVVARSDITAALEACDLLLKEVRDFMEDYKHGKYTPLLNAIIVCYARPFTNNKPFGPLNKSWGIFNDKQQQVIHNDLIELRHKMIAHSDFNVRKVIIYPKDVPINDDIKYKSPAVSVSVSIKGLTLEYIEKIRAVCFHVGSRLNAEIAVELESIFGDESVPKEKIDLGEILGLP